MFTLAAFQVDERREWPPAEQPAFLQSCSSTHLPPSAVCFFALSVSSRSSSLRTSLSNIIIDHHNDCVIVCIVAFQVEQFDVGFSGRLVVVLLLFCFVDNREMGCLFISIPGWLRVALGSPDAWWRPLRPTPQLPRAHRTTIFYWSSVSQFLTSSVASSSQLVAQNNNLLLVLHKFIFNWQK